MNGTLEPLTSDGMTDELIEAIFNITPNAERLHLGDQEYLRAVTNHEGLFNWWKYNAAFGSESYLYKFMYSLAEMKIAYITWFNSCKVEERVLLAAKKGITIELAPVNEI